MSSPLSGIIRGSSGVEVADARWHTNLFCWISLIESTSAKPAFFESLSRVEYIRLKWSDINAGEAWRQGEQSGIGP
jgi:hypothetical protein